jgi:hypothetical protein
MDGGFPGVNIVQPFERLRTNNQILGGYNFVGRDTNLWEIRMVPMCYLQWEGIKMRLVGTAPDASYYLFITEDSSSENPVEESLWVEAAEEADRLGADIINTSLGYFDLITPRIITVIVR